MESNLQTKMTLVLCTHLVGAKVNAFGLYRPPMSYLGSNVCYLCIFYVGLSIRVANVVADHDEGL